MLSASGVGIRPASQFGLGISDPGSMETGEFDFMTYLLGLQGEGLFDNTSISGNSQLVSVQPKGDKQEIEEPVLSLFQGSNTAVNWNPFTMGNIEKQVAFNPSEKTLASVDDSLLKDFAIQKEDFSVSDASFSISSDRQGQLKADSTNAKENISEGIKSDGVGETTDSKFTLAMQQKEIGIKKYGTLPKVSQKPTLSENPIEMAKINSEQNEKKSVELEKSAPSLRESLSANGNHQSGIEKSQRKHGNFGSALDLGAALVASGNLNKVSGHEGVMATDKSAIIHEATVPQLFDRIESMASQGGGKMTVRLSPPSLGEVEIQVTTRGKNVEIEMRPESDAAKSVIESQINDLKTSMSSNDLVLSKMEVHVHREIPSSFETSVATQSGGNPSFHSSLPQGQSNQADSGRFFARHDNETQASFRTVSTPVTRSQLGSNSGRVDLRI